MLWSPVFYVVSVCVRVCACVRACMWGGRAYLQKYTQDFKCMHILVSAWGHTIVYVCVCVGVRALACMYMC